jgi:uncharacterized repeat protein (TIGR03803 family)
LYSFGGRDDGAIPEASLVFDAAGNLYGTTVGGGAFGKGTVFELMPSGGGSWTEQVVYSFRNSPDGAQPDTPVVLDRAGNIYGTTYGGGAYGNGTAFEILRSHPRGNIP